MNIVGNIWDDLRQLDNISDAARVSPGDVDAELLDVLSWSCSVLSSGAVSRFGSVQQDEHAGVIGPNRKFALLSARLHEEQTSKTGIGGSSVTLKSNSSWSSRAAGS